MSKDRDDLSGRIFGGVKLDRKIGSGGFGDVYVSPDHKVCVKVIFRENFDNPENFTKEVNAIKFISSCLREHCGIAKFLGSGRTNKNFNYFEPLDPCGGQRTRDSERYRQFPVVPDSLESDCRKFAEETSYEVFYYFMLAADNLAREPDYCPDTLENRCERGILGKMSDEEKIQVLAEIIDALLFLYHLEVQPSERCRFSSPEREVFHVTHGDIKPANIFFVNGHAQLGDMGGTLQVNPQSPAISGTREFMLQGFPKEKLKEKCGDDYFAYSVFSDIFALGKTAEYMMRNGGTEEFAGLSEFTRFSQLVNALKSFHANKKILPENVVWELRRFRSYMPQPDNFHRQSYYGTTAPDICLDDLDEFFRIWPLVEAESVKRFRVTNPASEWGRYSDILLAECFPVDREAEIREVERKQLAQNKTDGRPLLIFHLKKSREIIVLSHSKAAFSPSAEAYQLLQRHERGFRRRSEDPDFDFFD